MKTLNWIAIATVLTVLSGCAINPKKFGDADRDARIENDLQFMFAGQEELTGPLAFNEAVARGIKYNLDKRLKLMERGFAEARRDNASYDLLPAVVAKAGYDRRTSFNSSNSLNVQTGVRSNTFTTSSERANANLDLSMVWNVLDFGLSYVNAKQEAERARLAEERRIKVVQNLMVDVRDAYWRAVAAQSLIPRVGRLIRRVESAISRSRREVRDGIADPAQELKLQLALLNHVSKLQDVRRKLALAKVELAALINLKPDTQYTLASSSKRFHVPRIQADMFDLYYSALKNRPELRQEDFEKIVAELEVSKAKLRLLPGLEIRVSGNYDSNKFLKESLWASLGNLVTKNLMDLVRGPSDIRYRKANVAVADRRRQALSMAVITQVHISTIRYSLAKGAFAIKRRTFSTADQLSRVLRNSIEGDEVSPIEALEAESKRTVALIEYYAAYADVQNAYGRILNSLGSHRFPEHVEELSVSELADWLEDKVDRWDPIVQDLDVDGRSYGAPKVIKVQPRSNPASVSNTGDNQTGLRAASISNGISQVSASAAANLPVDVNVRPRTKPILTTGSVN